MRVIVESPFPAEHELDSRSEHPLGVAKSEQWPPASACTALTEGLNGTDARPESGKVRDHALANNDSDTGSLRRMLFLHCLELNPGMPLGRHSHRQDSAQHSHTHTLPQRCGSGPQLATRPPLADLVLLHRLDRRSSCGQRFLALTYTNAPRRFMATAPRCHMES